MLTWCISHLAARLLEQRDVARARIAAPHVLGEWEARGSRFWRGAFVSPFVGAIVPLVGCLVLGWTPGLVLLALTADVAVLWVCDAVKRLLARSRVDEERAHHDEAGDVLAVIHALRRPRLPLGRDLLARTPRRRLYVSALPSHLDRPQDRQALIGVTFFLFVLFAFFVAMTSAHAVPLLLAGATLRLGVCVLRTMRARRDSGPRPDLLPEAGIPTLSLMLALYPAFVVLAGLDIDTSAIGSQGLALCALSLHLVVAGVISALGIRYVHRATTELRAFVARDPTQLEERLRRING
jgi:hypothetical protein